MKVRVCTYVLDGCYTNHGGQDDDGISFIEERFESTEQEAIRKFQTQLEELKTDHCFVGSKKPYLHTIEISLKCGTRTVRRVHIYNEERFEVTTRVIYPGRGWVTKDKWRKHTFTRKQYKNKVVHVSSAQNFHKV